MKLLSAVLTILFSMCAFNAKANLIINGSFEDNRLRDRSWNWFSSDRVLGWEGSNIEIWRNLQGFSSDDGSQHIELNAHRGGGDRFSIFQTFDTVIGTIYDYSFAYSARRSLREAFEVSFLSGDQTIQLNTIDDHIVKQWRTFESFFTASSARTTIMFSSIWPVSGTVGNFIDDISVVQRPEVQRRLAFASNQFVNQGNEPASLSSSRFVNQVSEPASLALFLSALGLVVIRQRKKITQWR